MISQIRSTMRSRVIPDKILTRSQSKNVVTKLSVEHDMSDSKFYVALDSQKAILQYSEVSDLIIFRETEVPPIFQGKGVAKMLAEAALKYAASKKLAMKVECTFIQHYIDKYAPEYQKHCLRN